MGSTTVHIPDDLLKKMDSRVRDLGISRNRFVIQACEKALEEQLSSWPESVLVPEMESGELDLLREAAREMQTAIHRARRNKGAPLL